MAAEQSQATGEVGGDAHQLQERVSRPLPGVVLFREPPVVTFDTMDVMWDRAAQLYAGQTGRMLIADLSETGLPSANIRARLRNELRALEITHVALVLGQNSIMQTATRFVLTMILPEYRTSVHSSVDEALSWAKSASPRGGPTG